MKVIPKETDYQLKYILTWIMKTIYWKNNQYKRQEIQWTVEIKQKQKQYDKELKRTNRNVLTLNTVPRTENVKDISYQLHHTGKYSDYESYNSVHYPPGHNLNYYLDECFY